MNSASGWTSMTCSKYLGISMGIASFLLSCVFPQTVNSPTSITVLFALLEYVCLEVIFKVLPFIRKGYGMRPAMLPILHRYLGFYASTVRFLLELKESAWCELRTEVMWLQFSSLRGDFMGVSASASCLLDEGMSTRNFPFYIRIQCHQFLIFPQCGSDREKSLSYNTCRHLGLMPRRSLPPTSIRPHSSLGRQARGSAVTHFMLLPRDHHHLLLKR